MIQGNRFSCNVYDPLDQSFITSWIHGINFVGLKDFILDFKKIVLTYGQWEYGVNLSYIVYFHVWKRDDLMICLKFLNILKLALLNHAISCHVLDRKGYCIESVQGG